MDGSTTSWSQWAGEAEPALPFFPAAQQLESLRRVNLAAGGRLDRAVADALLTDGITDRNRGDLPLSGEEIAAFGPPAVDPATLPAADLLPVVVGPIARRLAAGGAEPEPRRPLPFVRGWRPAGDPWLVEHLTAAQRRSGRARPGRRTLVLAADLPTMAVHTWAMHAVSGGRLNLLTWLRERITPTRVPASLDLAGLARRSAEQVGARHTTIALDTRPLRHLVAPPLDQTAVEVARWVGRPLGVLAAPERRRALLLHVLLPRATRAPRMAGAVTLPEPWHSRLTAYAETQRDALRAGGYPVLGSLDALLPAPAERPTAFPTDRDVLARAIDLLLEPLDTTNPGEGVPR